ncbi:hypothetical protein IE53DRAFT_206191 [Violaceomyces palustris]|uniref:Uncharacterized protein n=1 Tax=Violaceomyces palustris TaxID=1673888 RepID=A0ACD0P557_9BASI|nr:hypothetical protein IE53DRAFT_206191 [Violaceomyces palustris]
MDFQEDHLPTASTTAAALLQARRQLESAKDNGAAELHGRLKKATSSLTNIKRIMAQLETLSKKPTSSQQQQLIHPLGPLAFVQAKLATNQSVYLEEQDPTSDANPSSSSSSSSQTQAIPLLTTAFQDQASVKAGNRVYVKQTPSQAIKTLMERSRNLEAQIKVLNDEIVRRANSQVRDQLKAASLPEHPFSADGQQRRHQEDHHQDHIVNENNQVLNEEGLPFFEPIERIPDSPPLQPADPARVKKRVPGVVEPFVRSAEERERSREERRRWMDDIFGKLEREEELEDEEGDLQGEQGGQVETPAEEETRVVLRQKSRTPSPSPPLTPRSRVTSAERPAPAKGALKNKGRSQPISFGSSGIRRGFLNLNPSSPGAIHSSDPIDKSDGSDGRTSRSDDPTSSRDGRDKKTVRIQSPERFRKGLGERPSANVGGLSALQKALQDQVPVQEKGKRPAGLGSGSEKNQRQKRHPDDVGVEDEAARIVQLLGPDIVQGHPNAPNKEEMAKLMKSHNLGPQVEFPDQASASSSIGEKQKEKKPALAQSVMERTPGGSKLNGAKGKEEIERARQSAFKKGFLLNKPSSPLAKFAPIKPPPRTPSGSRSVEGGGGGGGEERGDPRISQGITALDRASKADLPIEARRVEMGLPPAVPHARPSKAYAEKLEKERMMEESGSGPSKVDEKRGARDLLLPGPTEEDAQTGQGGVRFAQTLVGDAQGVVAEEEEEENVDQINGIREEESEEEEDRPMQVRESGHGPDSDSSDPEEEDDEDEDDDWDSEEGYNTDDINALAPDLDELDLDEDFNSAEIAREYARARAGLIAGGYLRDGDGNDELDDDQDDEDGGIDIVPLDASVGDEDGTSGTSKKPKVSRFKSTRDQREGSRIRSQLGFAEKEGPGRKSQEEIDKEADERGHQLAHMLEKAMNVGPNGEIVEKDEEGGKEDDGEQGQGPVMVIPSMMPSSILYPKGGQILLEGSTPRFPELEGESTDDEEEDERRKAIMRSRIERMEWKTQNPEEYLAIKKRRQVEMGSRGLRKPPTILSSSPLRGEEGRGNEKDPMILHHPSEVGVEGGASSSSDSQGQPRSATHLSDDLVTDKTSEQTKPKDQPDQNKKKVSRFKASRSNN